MREHSPSIRWVDPGLQTAVELSCICGRFAVTFKPKEIPGQPLPLTVAMNGWHDHRVKEWNLANAGRGTSPR